MDIDEILEELGAPKLHPARGRKPLVGLSVGEPRPLTTEEVALALAEPVPLPTSMSVPLQKIRSRHHQLAQLLAMGKTDWETSLALGYSPSRISVLKADPTFRELLAFYERQQQDLHLDISARLTGISMEALETLQQRLDDDPDEFSNRELMDLAELSLDRSGYGKSSTVQVMHGLDEETHAFLKAQHETSKLGEVHNLSEGQIIDIIPNEAQDSLEAAGCEAPGVEATLHSDPETPIGLDDFEGFGVSEKVGEALRDAFPKFRPQVIRGDKEDGPRDPT